MANSLYRPTGVSGLPRPAGYVLDEWLPDLQGPRGRRILREMQDNDAIIGAILFSLEMLIRQVEWTVQPGDDTPEAVEAATFIDECLHDMQVTWEDTLSEILSFLPYGWAVLEQVYKRRTGTGSKHADGRIGWHSWQLRGQETLQKWEFDDLGTVLGMWQQGPPDYQQHYIPLQKALLFRTSTRRGNPEGRSILRNAFRSWYMKKRIEQIEGIGIERDLAGLPVMYVPSEILTNPNEAQTRLDYENLISNVRRDEQEGVLLPSDRDVDSGQLLYELKLLTTGGQRQFDTDSIIARHDQRITMCVMADFIMLGHERVGSNALAQSKSKLFTAALGSYLNMIRAVINNDAIPRLLKLNGMQVDQPPTLEHGDIERADLDTLGNFILHLSQAGVQLDLSSNGPLVRHLMGQARLPEPPEADAETVDPGMEGGDTAPTQPQNEKPEIVQPPSTPAPKKQASEPHPDALAEDINAVFREAWSQS